ncbi:MAG: hypothetical protein AB7F86_03915 [Bdellovibrionales bacterium]
MKNQMLAAGLLAAVMTLAACDETERSAGEPAKTYDVDAIITATDLTNNEKSEMLAQIGEALSTPVGFMYANEVLDQAIRFNAENPRANFYKHLVAPAMVTKGLIKRMQPLADKMSDVTRTNYDQMKEQVALSESLNAFANEGAGDILTEEKAQQVLQAVYREQDKLRLFTKGFKANVLKISPMVIKGPPEAYLADCQVRAIGPRAGYHAKYDVSPCPWQKKFEATIDRGDIEVLQHAFAGYEISTILATSYDATGGVMYEHFAQNPTTSVREKVQFIQNLGMAGKLKPEAPITMIHGLGTDIYSGARWAQRYQDRLCPKGHYQLNRPGRLFAQGICVQDLPDPKMPRAESALRVFAAALGGMTTDLTIEDGRVVVDELSRNAPMGYRTKTQAFAPITNPVADLKGLLPTQFDRCGGAQNVGESTLGGLLPNGDGNEVARQLGWFDSTCPF